MICINLIRVSADSKYLDINVESSRMYNITWVRVTRFDGTNWLDKDAVDLSPQLQPKSNKQRLRIGLEGFGGTGMFKVEMRESWVGEGEEPTDSKVGCKPSELVTTAYASDVSFVYKHLLTKLLNMNCDCYKVDEDLERNFMFLYAHQEAMQMNRIAEATKFYTALYKNFNKCGPINRIGTPCNCQTRPSRPVAPGYGIKAEAPKGCGCGKR